MCGERLAKCYILTVRASRDLYLSGGLILFNAHPTVSLLSSQTHLHDDTQKDENPAKDKTKMKSSAKDVQSGHDGDNTEIIVLHSLEAGGVTTSLVREGEGEAEGVGTSRVQAGDAMVQQEPKEKTDGDSLVPTSPDESSGGQGMCSFLSSSA